MSTSESDIKECFDCFDTDKDGKIGVDEIGTVIRALGKAPMQKEVYAMEEEAGGKNVDFNAFKGYYRRKFKRPEDLYDGMLSAFRALDNTGKGIISAGDLRMLMGNMGEALDPQEVDSLLKCCDIDRRGNLMYEDLCNMMCNV